MKTLIHSASLILFSVLAFTMLAETTMAQERGNDEPRVSPNATVSQTIGTTEVTITYGRPAMNDRDIFGDLVPMGEVWRTGANESTVIHFPEDVTVEGEEVPEGTYSLYTIPEDDEWTIIINSNLSWGTEYDENEDVVRVSTEPMEGSEIEQFMIYFENVSENSADVVLHWDTTKVPFTIEV